MFFTLACLSVGMRARHKEGWFMKRFFISLLYAISLSEGPGLWRCAYGRRYQGVKVRINPHRIVEMWSSKLVLRTSEYELRNSCFELVNICDASFVLPAILKIHGESLRHESSFEVALIAGIPRDTSTKALLANDWMHRSKIEIWWDAPFKSWNIVGSSGQQLKYDWMLRPKAESRKSTGFVCQTLHLEL